LEPYYTHPKSINYLAGSSPSFILITQNPQSGVIFLQRKMITIIEM
jgi:hypothetical protein